MIDKTSAWRANMTEPRTLHEGGTGLGRDMDADTAELNKWDMLYPALRENQALREAILRIEAELAKHEARYRWLTLTILAAFIFGFWLALALTAAGVESLR